MNCNVNMREDLVSFFSHVGWLMDCCKVLVAVFYAVAAIVLLNRQIPAQMISLISQIFQVKIMDRSLMILVSAKFVFLLFRFKFIDSFFIIYFSFVFISFIGWFFVSNFFSFLILFCFVFFMWNNNISKHFL